MANESTSATIVGVLRTEYVTGMLNYAKDPVVALPHLRAESVAGKGTKTASFPVATKDTALSGNITEATGLSNTQMDITNSTVTIAEFGVLRQMSKLGSRTNVLGEVGLYDFLLQDGSFMCWEKAETDAWAQWANASTSVGSSGQGLTLGNLAAAISQRSINKAQGPGVFFLTTTQVSDMRAALLSSNATVFSNGQQNRLLEQAADDGFVGTFFGRPVFTNTLGASSGANKIGALVTDGMMSPPNASTGWAVGWTPEPESVSTPELPGYRLAITMASGVGEVNDYQYTKIVTVA